MKKLILAAVVMLFSTTTMAEPSGSLKAMLNTQITLIEYLELKVLIGNVQRGVGNHKSFWQAGEQNYKAVVNRYVEFDYEENKLVFSLHPMATHTFNSIENAKAYCQALIKTGNLFTQFGTGAYITPNGWGNSGTNNEGYLDGIRKNVVLKTSIYKGQFEGGKLPDNMRKLECIGRMDAKGEIASWSFNL